MEKVLLVLECRLEIPFALSKKSSHIVGGQGYRVKKIHMYTPLKKNPSFTGLSVNTYIRSCSVMVQTNKNKLVWKYAR